MESAAGTFIRGTPLPSLQSALGFLGILTLAWALSEGRRSVPWQKVAWGVALQFFLALVLLKIPLSQQGLHALNTVAEGLTQATRDGTAFVFGYLGGGALPFTVDGPGSSFVLAFQALPLILIISALSALLFHWNVIPVIVRAFAWILQRTIGVGGPVGVSTAMNIFVGMVEAPLVVRPYLRTESRAGLFIIMSGGMASVSGSVMFLYATFLTGVIPNPLGQLLTASIIAAPAAIVVSMIMIPGAPPGSSSGPDSKDVQLARDPKENAMSAITRGTGDGLHLFLHVIAMLLVFVALVSLVNGMMTLLPDVGNAPLTLERVFGWLMAPLAWLVGVPWNEAAAAGSLLGIKTVLNELIAYTTMAQLPSESLSERSRIIMTHALCGFANFSSLGIMIGGLVAMVPERRDDIIALAPRTLISDTLGTCLAGAGVGIIL